MNNESLECIDHKLLLNQIPKKLGIDFLPLIFSKFADKPETLKSIWTLLDSVLLQGNLHRLTKEMVFVVTANVKKCHYCVVSHKAFAKNLGLTQELVECLDGDLRYIEPASTRHLLEFAKSLASNLEFDSESKYQQLLEEGYNQSELDELVLTVGVASMLTTLANGMELNSHVDQNFYQILRA